MSVSIAERQIVDLASGSLPTPKQGGCVARAVQAERLRARARLEVDDAPGFPPSECAQSLEGIRPIELPYREGMARALGARISQHCPQHQRVYALAAKGRRGKGIGRIDLA